ncbi:MAG: ribonuclease HIII [Myxococcales bacterium]|nr:ribonuclease HIII [Myxococcales bacterium]
MTQTTRTIPLSASQARDVRARLAAAGFSFTTAPYAFFQARAPGVTITFYEKGKVLLQGTAVKDYVGLVLDEDEEGDDDDGTDSDESDGDDSNDDREPKPAARGSAASWATFHPAPPPAAWAGLDETGKGDYFGPLVVVAAALRRSDLPLLIELGVTDSKSLTDKRILEIAKELGAVCTHHKVVIGPEKYNELYDRARNLNKLLGWAHARALEGVLEKTSEPTWALSDQFSADPRVITTHFGPLARAITWTQRPKAEADPAVAAASILARAEFVYRMKALSREIGRELPKGAGPPVLAAARALVASDGPDALRKVAKLHFKTTQDVAPGWRP